MTAGAPVSSNCYRWLAGLLPFPASDAHKYSRGRLFAIAGCNRYAGAACLAATAALRLGAGYVQAYCEEGAQLPLRLASPSLVVSSWDALDFATKGAGALPANKPERPCACLVGSGFDASDESQLQLVLLVLRHAAMPVLVDGGGLHALASAEAVEVLRMRQAAAYPTILTPHAGEAEKLLEAASGMRDKEALQPLRLFDQDDRISQENLARYLARFYCATVNLKGPQSVICNGSKTLCMDQGTSALAKAGTGDVLAGMTASLLAQGLDALGACALAAYLHAFAGAEAAAELTPLCVCAEDLSRYFPQAIARLQSRAAAEGKQ